MYSRFALTKLYTEQQLLLLLIYRMITLFLSLMNKEYRYTVFLLIVAPNTVARLNSIIINCIWLQKMLITGPANITNNALIVALNLLP